VQVDLHLREMLRFALAHAFGDELLETLGRVRLEFQDVPGLGGFQQASVWRPTYPLCSRLHLKCWFR
jgi:hypothetical protein